MKNVSQNLEIPWYIFCYVWKKSFIVGSLSSLSKHHPGSEIPFRSLAVPIAWGIIFLKIRISLESCLVNWFCVESLMIMDKVLRFFFFPFISSVTFSLNFPVYKWNNKLIVTIEHRFFWCEKYERIAIKEKIFTRIQIQN